jgi:hypothetical protein
VLAVEEVLFWEVVLMDVFHGDWRRCESVIMYFRLEGFSG